MSLQEIKYRNGRLMVGKVDNHNIAIRVEFRLKENSEFFRTIDLQPVAEPAYVLSISGQAPHCCGQIQEQIRKWVKSNRIEYSAGWSPERLTELLDIWDRWHLNDLRPGCRHQAALGWKACLGHFDSEKQETCSNKVKRLATHEEIESAVREAEKEGVSIVGKSTDFYYCNEDKINQPCPVCGYKFGSAWLFEYIPQEVIEKITKSFFKLRNPKNDSLEGETMEKVWSLIVICLLFYVAWLFVEMFRLIYW